MKTFTEFRSRNWLICGVLLSVVLAAACSSLPPAQQAVDAKSLAGMWEGQIIFRSGLSAPAIFKIYEDGRYEGAATGYPVSIGKVSVVDGKYRYFSNTRMVGGTLTLHEGGGQRVLRLNADEGFFGEYRPAK